MKKLKCGADLRTSLCPECPKDREIVNSNRLMVHQLEGHPAEDLAKFCFSKLRFYPATLKDRLRREGLWEDLTQELYLIALEGWRQGMTAEQMGSMAGRGLRTFLEAYGYHRYQRDGDGFAKREMPLLDGWERLVKVEPCEDGDSVERAILNLLRKHPKGLSQTQVNRTLHHVAPAVVISDHCARLVIRGLVKEVARPTKSTGRPPSPMLYPGQRKEVRQPPTCQPPDGRLDEKMLYFLRKHPEGLTRSKVAMLLWPLFQISVQEVDRCLAPMIEQGKVVEIKRENTRGRPLSSLLVAPEPGQAPPEPKMVKTEQTERIRHAYFVEGKGIKRIAKEFHHCRRTVRKAIHQGEAKQDIC